MRSLFVFPLLIITTTSNPLMNKLSQIINLSIPKQNCVYFFGSGKSFIFEAISKLPIYVLTNPQADEVYSCSSNGYIVEYEDESDIAALFRHIQIFRPHNRILIVTKSGHNLRRLVMKAKYHALNVWCIELVLKNQSGLLPEILVDVKVVDLLSARVIFAGSKAEVDQARFILEPWVPRFERAPIKVLTHPYPPYAYKFGAQWRGLELKLMNHLTRSWPVQYIEYPPGSWSVMIEDVEMFRGNMSVAAHWRYRIISHNLDLTYSCIDVQSTFIVPKSRLKNMANLIVRPFRVGIWCLVVVSIVITAITMHQCDVGGTCSTLDGVFIGVNCLSMNSFKFILRSRVGVIIIFWSMTSLLLSTAYSAGFTSVVYVPGYTKAINTFKDLYESNLTCSVSSSYMKEVTQQSLNPYLGLFADNIHVNRSTLETRCIGGDILYQRLMVLPHLIDKRINWRWLKEYYQSSSLVIILNKNSPYTKIFNNRIKRLCELGLIEFWFKQGRNDFENVFVKNNFKAGAPKTPFTFEKFQSAFYLWMCGIATSIVCFCVEKCCYMY